MCHNTCLKLSKTFCLIINVLPRELQKVLENGMYALRFSPLQLDYQLRRILSTFVSDTDYM